MLLWQRVNNFRPAKGLEKMLLKTVTNAIILRSTPFPSAEYRSNSRRDMHVLSSGEISRSCINNAYTVKTFWF